MGNGTIGYTHEALDALPHSPSREHIRALLVQHELLQPRDRFLAAFHSWLDEKLATVDGEQHALLLRRFATWTTLRRARQRLHNGQSTEGVLMTGRQNIIVAAQLLNWLTVEHLDLSGLQQLDLDRWITSGSSTRLRVRPFLRWAADAGEAHRCLAVARGAAPTLRWPRSSASAGSVDASTTTPSRCACAPRRCSCWSTPNRSGGSPPSEPATSRQRTARTSSASPAGCVLPSRSRSPPCCASTCPGGVPRPTPARTPCGCSPAVSSRSTDESGDPAWDVAVIDPGTVSRVLFRFENVEGGQARGGLPELRLRADPRGPRER